MTNLAEQARKADTRAFNTWFNRWCKKYKMENRVMQSANQGIDHIVICESDNPDYVHSVYEARRFEDERFTTRLKQEYPDLTFEWREHSYKNLLGMTRTRHRLVVGWEKSE
ncbi:MAG: hypothetical protein LKF37_10230 [Lentilactobacillus diolivorans]|jgi:hypothetical protein|nr:hypothetical protein [Lentilactobacillus diolivorans]